MKRFFLAAGILAATAIVADAENGNRVRYTSPTFAGFTLSSSWGEDDYWDVALGYANQFGGIRVAAGAQYYDDAKKIAFGGTGCSADTRGTLDGHTFTVDTKFLRTENLMVVIDPALYSASTIYEVEDITAGFGCNLTIGGYLSGSFKYGTAKLGTGQPIDLNANGNELGIIGPQAMSGFVIPIPFGDVSNFQHEAKYEGYDATIQYQDVIPLGQPTILGGLSKLFGPAYLVPGIRFSLGRSDIDETAGGWTNGNTFRFDYDNEVRHLRAGVGVSLELVNVLGVTRSPALGGDLITSTYHRLDLDAVYIDSEADSVLRASNMGVPVPDIAETATDKRTSLGVGVSGGFRFGVPNKVRLEIGGGLRYWTNQPKFVIDANQGATFEDSERYDWNVHFGARVYF
jgi:hypothetical protein